MTGTKAGAAKVVETIRKKYGDNFYRNIGKKGGSVCGTQKGFASYDVGRDGLTGHERARIAGFKGGIISRRGPAKAEHE